MSEEKIDLKNVIENSHLAPDPKGKTLLIDADTIAYATCCTCEQELEDGTYTIDLEYALSVAIERVEEIKTVTGVMDVELHFTGGRDNFRYKIFPDYKANRKGDRVPPGLADLKGLLLENYPGKWQTDFEADDAVVSLKSLYPDKYILCSPDKDVYLGCAGTNFNYYRRPAGGNLVKDIKMSWVLVTETEAELWTHMQVLMGDSSDGIAGITKCGPAKAIELLAPEMKDTIKEFKNKYKAENGKALPAEKMWKELVKEKVLTNFTITPFELWNRVVKAYKENGMSEKQAILNMRLVNMKQMSPEGLLDLWIPPREE